MASLKKDSDLHLANNDFERLKANLFKEGLREGRDEGYADILKERDGDETRFHDGLHRTLTWGEMLGRINALITHAEKLGHSDSLSKLKELEKDALKQKELNCKDPLCHSSPSQPESSPIEQLRLELDKMQFKE